MDHPVVTRIEPPRFLAAVREEMPAGEVPRRFAAALDRVYAATKAAGISVDGQNVFVYRDAGSNGRVLVEFGVGVSQSFAALGDVECITLPAGEVATTTHFGAYEALGRAHDAIHEWARKQGRALERTRWEVYGHWEEDAAKRRTDVFYLLAREPMAATTNRVALGIIGLGLLALVSLFTLGMALLTPVGMYVADRVARRDGHRLTRGMSWFGAVLAANLGIMIFGGVALTRLPGGVTGSLQHLADSAAATSKTQKPPDWMERIAPGASARAQATPTPKGLTKAFVLWAAVIGGVIACTFFALIVGTLGWLPSLLLAYAATGRWLAGPVPPQDDVA